MATGVLLVEKIGLNLRLDARWLGERNVGRRERFAYLARKYAIELAEARADALTLDEARALAGPARWPKTVLTTTPAGPGRVFQALLKNEPASDPADERTSGGEA